MSNDSVSSSVPNVVTLRAELARTPRLAVGRAVAIVSLVARELDARGGGVGGVVTPSSIMVGPDGVAWLIDSAGVGVAESMAYVAPERLSGSGAVGAGADVYGLACVLYECVTGAVPVPVESGGGELGSAVPLPSAVNGSVPWELDAVIMRGLAPDPLARYGSAGEFAQAARLASASGFVESESGPPMYSASSRAPQSPQPPVTASRGRKASRRNKVAITIAVVTLVPVLAIAVAIGAGVNIAGLSFRSMPGASVEPSAAELLPFGDIPGPSGIAVDDRGSVYVMSSGTISVIEAGTGHPRQIDFPSLEPVDGNRGGLAVDAAGDLYLLGSSGGANRIRKLRPRTGDVVDLPFPPLRTVAGIAVDSTGSVYIVDCADASHEQGPTKVWKLDADASEATALPFPNLPTPMGIGVDGAGGVYVLAVTVGQTPQNPAGAGVWSLAAGANLALRMSALGNVQMASLFPGQWLAVDHDGNIAVATGSRVLRARRDSHHLIELPLEGPGVDIDQVDSIAVDRAGNVYAVGLDDGSGCAVRLKVA